jgi:hypothetical protein
MEDNTIVVECPKTHTNINTNIKYKNMLLNGLHLSETKSSNDLSSLEKFLHNKYLNIK